MPPVEAWDSGGEHAASAGGRYDLRRSGSGWALAVSVDEGWLRDQARVFPVSVDPTFWYPVTTAWAYRSTGYTCQNCGLQIGNSQAGAGGGDSYNHSLMRFDFPSVAGQTVVGARLDVARYNGGTFHRAWPRTDWRRACVAPRGRSAGRRRGCGHRPCQRSNGALIVHPCPRTRSRRRRWCPTQRPACRAEPTCPQRGHACPVGSDRRTA